MQYLRPKSLKEALKILADKSKKIKILSGGTDLVIALKEKRQNPDILLDIGSLKELYYIKEKNNLIKIGPLATHSDIIESNLIAKYAPVLKQSCLGIGAVQIRNRGTLGGNIGNASPAGDTIPALMVLEAQLKLKSLKKERSIKIEDCFVCPGKTKINPDEIITEIIIPKSKKNNKSFFLKLGQRKALAISKISLAFVAEKTNGKLKSVRIALGAVAPTVIKAKATEKFLENKKLTPETIKGASEIISSEAKPIDDIRSTKSYRQKMAGVLLAEGLTFNL